MPVHHVLPSEAPTPELALALPNYVPDPEQLVYDYVLAATEFSLPTGRAALSFYADSARALSENRRIGVARGWPAYPGPVPSLGVAAGNEGEDQQRHTLQGGYVGRREAHDPDNPTVLLGVADYYSEPLYIPVIVVLVHENRDERDRLHNQLRLVLTPLRTHLPALDPLINRVYVDAQKDEVATEGPPANELPWMIYSSTFTVHVHCEMLTARDVTAAADLLARIDVEAVPADSAP